MNIKPLRAFICSDNCEPGRKPGKALVSKPFRAFICFDLITLGGAALIAS